MSAAAATVAGTASPEGAFDSYVRELPDGSKSLHLIVEGVHCGGCVKRIERRLAAEPDVLEGRVNLTTRRLALRWAGPAARGGELAEAVAALGFGPVPYEPGRLESEDDRRDRELLRAMAVAGFAAANVMLLSVAVWAGHFHGMGSATRGLLHWFSALVALPAIVYAGRPFFASAIAALRHRRTNMDVPISLGVILAAGMSLFETLRGGEHVYFDSAIALLFFLLVGRYLDHRARGRARSAAERLLSLGKSAVTVLDEEGRRLFLPIEQVRTGMTIAVAAGERIGVDGRVLNGTSEVDSSLITGESIPAPVRPGDAVFAGSTNIGAAITLQATAVGESTLLAEIVRLMEVAEQGRARYVALADRVARYYAPVVHLLALGTFLGWLVLVGIAWQPALLIAISVLIVTCPCALGLAVPAVQVIASGRLLRWGILLKSATALERLAEVDSVVLDKTGTLTVGRPVLQDVPAGDPDALALAGSMAACSRHPLAVALAAGSGARAGDGGVREVPGCGLALDTPEGEIRLGSRRWAGGEEEDRPGLEMWLHRPGRQPVRFGFADPPRPDAASVIAGLRRRGLQVTLLSGDRSVTVADTARGLGISDWQAECTPERKVEQIEALQAEGRRVLMVGDGLNDAPSLAAASVSLSPSSAIDITQTAADAVFQGELLHPVLDLLDVSRRAQRLVRQNFVLAFAYNSVTIPLAVAGYVTPLIAAICMSASSLLVVGNALRLSLSGGGAARASQAPPPVSAEAVPAE